MERTPIKCKLFKGIFSKHEDIEKDINQWLDETRPSQIVYASTTSDSQSSSVVFAVFYLPATPIE